MNIDPALVEDVREWLNTVITSMINLFPDEFKSGMELLTDPIIPKAE